MQKTFNIWTVLLEAIELSFIVFLPLPTWLSIILFIILGFFGGFLPFSIIPFLVAGWVWAYIYIWLNIQNTGMTIFYMIMLLLFGLDIWLTKMAYQNMLPMQRPPIVTTKRFSVKMWSVTICAFIADIVMLIHLIV